LKNLSAKEIELLAGTFLFRDIHPGEIKKLIKTVPVYIKTFEKNSIIAFPGDTYDNLYILLQGTCAAEITDYEEKTLLVETLSQGDMIASGILFAEENCLPVQLTARTHTEMLVIPKNSILALCKNHEKILSNYFQDMGNKINFLAGKIRFHQFNTIKQKTAVYFIDLYNRQKSLRPRIPYTIEKLSELFGSARPALSRILAELVETGILGREGRSYIIKDLDRLKSLQ